MHNMSGFKGRTHTEETKEKMRGPRPNIQGEKNPMKNHENVKRMLNSRQGYKHSEETKQKIREKNIENSYWKGKELPIDIKLKISKSSKGRNAWNKGKSNIYTKETLEKMRQSRLGKYSGENSSRWKGGISCEPYCEQWLDKEYKESIKERDGYMCLNPECSKTTDKICIHHIDYNKKNCHPLNLITVCVSCNSKANKNRKWHKAWYQVIIKRRYICHNL